VKRVWIIDVDAHKGDGVAAITEGDDTIITLSAHMAHGWPLDLPETLEDGSPNPVFIPSDIDIPIDRGEEDQYCDRLREGLRARDAAIFAMVDSMFMQYGKNVQGLPDQEKKMLLGKMERHNVVAEIHQAAEQNLKFLETTQLTGKDLVQMLREQHKFSSYWKGLGPRLSNLYVNRREREREVAAIDTVIAQWGRKADTSLWAGLYKQFTDNKIAIDSFSNVGEFVANLGNYLDTQGGDKNAPEAERNARLNNFLKTVWNPSVGTQWIPMLVDQGIMTKDQQTQLQSKLTAWEEASKPSYTLLYILIVLVAIVLVFFILRRGRRRSIPPPPSQN
jgi:hypothetical protein